jgi:Zn-dependent peptidase ImmA (M78 family)/DNA-binding XRE family transcriptional regulator
MARSIPALVNPPLLVWAREEAGYPTPEAAAKKVGVSADKLRAWETEGSESRPTLRQAEKLAAVYHRPMPVFYLSSPPESVAPAAEYRRLPGVTAGKESPSLRLALRELRRRREVALELLEENEEPLPPFALSARQNESADIVGERLRDALGVSPEEQRGWKNEYQAWRTWRDRAENLNVLVFQVSGVEWSEMRGVALFREPLPVVGVNSKEHPLSRAFTLLHELTHLMLVNGGDERPAAEENRTDAAWRSLERFAEAVAAAALMPGDALLAEPEVRRHRGAEWHTEEIRILAARYRVSPVALFTRLVNLRQTTWDFYREWRADWEKRWLNRPKKPSTGGPSRVETILSRVGPTYAALVLDSLERDQISPLAAADALDLKPQHFANLKLELMPMRRPA